MFCFLRTCLSPALWGAALACTLPAQAAPLDVSDSELTAQAVLSSLGFDGAANAENPQAQLIYQHVKKLLALKGAPEHIKAQLAKAQQTDAALQDDEQLTAQMLCGSADNFVRLGMLRLTKPERKRLFIYDLSKTAYFDPESCSLYLSGQSLLPPEDYAQGAGAFFQALSAEELSDYLNLIYKAFAAELQGSPARAVLSAEDLILGKAAYSAALDHLLETNPQLRSIMEKTIVYPDKADAAARCLTQQSLLTALLSIKGTPGDAALLAALLQPAAMPKPQQAQ